MELTTASLHLITLKLVVKLKTRTKLSREFLKKTVKYNPAIWSRKLYNTLWAFRTAYKTPTGTTPYKLIYRKNFHLPFEIEHRAYWALKNYNPDLIAAVKHQYPFGYVELYGKDGKTFIVNGHRLKLYHEEDNYSREAVTPFFPKECLSKRVPFDQRNNPPKNQRIVYPPILDINHFRHFLVTLENLYPMDDEPMWAADRIVSPTPGKQKHGWTNSTKELSKHGMNSEPLSLADSFPQLFSTDSKSLDNTFPDDSREKASDEELEGPMKDQPLSADASPTALSPGYIANSDRRDKEGPERSCWTHPADG
ncbi:reverse transcriptase domain-containing protein [Tanacetum coccineum]|uniref:Reverse transcriptase domain-containing protein n=1 Tax=Tanacetum coccineum TaxID=301880 RepID=A0ABQ5B512_9ASTR